MQIFGKLFLLLILAACCGHPKDPKHLLTENRYIPEEDFLRISEYFTGREPKTDRILLRSQDDSRGGYYWIFGIEGKLEENEIAEVVLEVQIPGSPETESFIFSVDQSLTDSNTLWIGLTGTDWPGPKFRPVAWRILFLSPQDEEILLRESYLWDLTPTAPPLQSVDPTNGEPTPSAVNADETQTD